MFSVLFLINVYIYIYISVLYLMVYCRRQLLSIVVSSISWYTITQIYYFVKYANVCSVNVQSLPKINDHK